MKHVFFVLLFSSALCLTKAQTPPVPCNITFGNGLACNQTVDLEWEFFDNTMTSCGIGTSTGITFLTVIPINCGACTPPLTDFVIRITALDGCPVNPPYELKWSNIAGPGGVIKVPITSCPCAAPPPPISTCCDNGTSFFLSDPGWSAAN